MPILSVDPVTVFILNLAHTETACIQTLISQGFLPFDNSQVKVQNQEFLEVLQLATEALEDVSSIIPRGIFLLRALPESKIASLHLQSLKITRYLVE